MKTIESYGLLWEAHSPSRFSHTEGGYRVMVGFNGCGWQLGLNDTYREREFPSRDLAMAAFAIALGDARRAAEGVHVSEIGE